MKIKKVDDKPMVIHTKKKAKLHTHEPKKASIKASNIYTVDLSPKIKGSKIATTENKKFLLAMMRLRSCLRLEVIGTKTSFLIMRHNMWINVILNT